jgi:cyclic beta-1,2-glucan synthetase
MPPARRARAALAVPRIAAALGGPGLRSLVTAAGTGAVMFDGFALTRWSADPVEDREGTLVYLADAGNGALWSVGVEPVAPRDGNAGASWAPAVFTLTREEHGIAARLEVCVVPGRALELRRLTLTNRTQAPRTISAAAALDVVLHHPAADASHPAFSRLFVQTAWDPGAGALLATRRPREAGESFPTMAFTLLEEPGAEHESDRARFLGRAPDRARPRALVDGGPLSGTVGNVLDPVFVLRATRTLAPGATATLTFALAAGWERASVLAALQSARAAGADALFAEAAAFAAPGTAWPGYSGRLVEGTGTAEFTIAAPTGPAPPVPANPPAGEPEALEFWNGYGGFANAGREYVLKLVPGPDGMLARPPQPWVNVLANEHFGCLVSETGAGTTWSLNSRERRLTPWANDAQLDPHGEALWLRDDESGAYFSPLPGPTPARAAYEMRHGFGASVCRVAAGGLEVETEVFVLAHDPLKVTRVRVKNVSGVTRRLSLAAYQRLVLGALPGEAGRKIRTWRDARGGALCAQDPADTRWNSRVTFAVLLAGEGAKPRAGVKPAFTCDRAAFLGEGGTVAAPRGLESDDALGGTVGEAHDPCFAQRAAFDLAPGAEATWALVFGDAVDEDAARELVERARVPGALGLARREVSDFWNGIVSAVRIETPSPALDLVMNGWLVYQTLACRMWGRTAFYQSGGAFGFRDQLQDASALLAYQPETFRAQIVLHAGHQFVEGDVLHWWHPPDDRGLRTRFADDLLWLPYLAATYVRATGDRAVLGEQAPYLTARALAPGEHEVFLAAQPSGESGDVYDHCVRAIDRALAVGEGAHGLPLFGCGDWNDGMNRVGQGGKGESVWMGFFLCAVLSEFAPLTALRGDIARAERYAAHRTRLEAVLETAGWDGGWYRRGYYDDGTPLGSSSSDECRIDALAQSWSVLAGVASPERARVALDAVERELVSPAAGIVRLLAPPFVDSSHDPGYIRGYVAGVRENGGQYTHAALWYARALAEAGRRGQAVRVLEMLSPVSHTQSAGQVATYQVEPYVIAADVYGAEPHVGRGGWTWYTGSAGWMIRVTLESVLGLREEGGSEYVVAPRVPDDWPSFRARLRRPDGTSYAFTVTNPSANAGAVVDAMLDGAPIAIVAGAARVPIVRDGKAHAVTITLGPHGA